MRRFGQILVEKTTNNFSTDENILLKSATRQVFRKVVSEIDTFAKNTGQKMSKELKAKAYDEIINRLQTIKKDL